MGTSASDIFKAQPVQEQPGRRTPNWRMMSPIVWAPIMYSMRHFTKGRVEPRTQHTLFLAATCLGLFHAGTVMFSDSTV